MKNIFRTGSMPSIVMDILSIVTWICLLIYSLIKEWDWISDCTWIFLLILSFVNFYVDIKKRIEKNSL